MGTPITSTENADHSTAALEQPTTTHSQRWSMVTMISVLVGLALAGLMTAAMFWIGDYYLGAQRNRDEEGRRKLQELRAAERKELETYGWINRTDGVVRIPIDRAMHLLADEAPRQRPTPPTPRGDQFPSR